MKRLPTKVKIHIATFVTWFVTGIWHGVAWHFIAWGLSNGMVIMISQELKPLYERFHKKFPKLQKRRSYDAFQILRTFLLLTFIRSFDIYFNVPLTLRQFGWIFTRPRLGEFFSSINFTEWLNLSGFDWIAAALGLAFWIIVPWFRRKKGSEIPHEATESLWRRKKPHAWVWAALVLVILVFGFYGLGYDVTGFIYGQF